MPAFCTVHLDNVDSWLKHSYNIPSEKAKRNITATAATTIKYSIGVAVAVAVVAAVAAAVIRLQKNPRLFRF